MEIHLSYRCLVYIYIDSKDVYCIDYIGVYLVIVTVVNNCLT